MSRPEPSESERQAALLIQQALREVDDIAAARPQGYADYPTNPNRGRKDTRAMTMKDAKRQAAYAAKVLRQAWEILDPPL